MNGKTLLFEHTSLEATRFVEFKKTLFRCLEEKGMFTMEDFEAEHKRILNRMHKRYFIRLQKEIKV